MKCLNSLTEAGGKDGSRMAVAFHLMGCSFQEQGCLEPFKGQPPTLGIFPEPLPKVGKALWQGSWAMRKATGLMALQNQSHSTGKLSLEWPGFNPHCLRLLLKEVF